MGAVTNGGFETGDFTGWPTDQWTSGSGTASLTVQSAQKYSGTYAAKIELAGNGYPDKASASFEQEMDLTDQLTLNFWIYVSNLVDGGDGVFLEVQIDGGTVYTRTTTTGGWIEVNIDVSAYSGVKLVHFRALCCNWEA